MLTSLGEGSRANPYIVVSGFEPFGGEKVNPAAETALSLDGVALTAGQRVSEREPVGEGLCVRIRSVIVPVSWNRALQTLLDALEGAAARVAPSCLAVVMLGQAGGYAGIGLERVAVNLAEGRDADGVERSAQPIVPPERGGAPAYFSTLPLRAIQSRIEEAGLPAFISNSAGTYLCNYLFYGLMHYLAATPGPGETAGAAASATAGPMAGFIHVPFLPEQAVGKKPIPPSMAGSDIRRAVRLALETVAEDALLRTHPGPGPGPERP